MFAVFSIVFREEWSFIIFDSLTTQLCTYVLMNGSERMHVRADLLLLYMMAGRIQVPHQAG